MSCSLLSPATGTIPYPRPYSYYPSPTMASSGTSSANIVGVHYRVGKKIGEGSFGVIFEGTPKSTPIYLSNCSLKTLSFYPLQAQIYSIRRLLPSNLYANHPKAPTRLLLLTTPHSRNQGKQRPPNSEMSVVHTVY